MFKESNDPSAVTPAGCKPGSSGVEQSRWIPRLRPRGMTLLVACCVLSFPLHADPLAEKQARIGIVTGDVGLLAQGAPEWIEPHEGLPIEAGDNIRTGEDGRIELIMSDNVVWVLQPESDVVMEHMDSSTGRFGLSSGTVTGMVNSSRTAGTLQRWEFNTPAAAIEIHGTQFAIECSKKSGTRLGVFEGDVEMQPAETAQGPQPPVQVSQGYECVINRGRPVRSIRGFSPGMNSLHDKMPALRRRLKQIEDTWSPFTTTTRKDFRKKFVAPPPKATRARPVPVRHPKGSRSTQN